MNMLARLPAFSSLQSSLRQKWRLISDCYHNEPGRFWHALLYASFWFSIALFPVSYAFREVSPVVCLFFLLMYYKHCWRQSVLAHFKLIWLYLCPLAMTLIGIVFSIHPWDSLLHAGTGVNKGFILPFIAMECARGKKELANLVWAFALACFWEGLDGIYQSVTGRDFVLGYALNNNRLTGSLGDYTVGNYLSLALIPAAASWLILRKSLSGTLSAFLCLALLWPGFYTALGASARSGMLAMTGAFFLWLILLKGWRHIYCWLLPLLIPLIFFIFQPKRLYISNISSDNRWDLWRLAWEVIKEHPWLGAGAGQYNAAFRELGLAPVNEVITISHPHNLYLDLLYAHGVIGFLLALIFLCGFLLWSYRKIAPKLHVQDADERLYWRITAFFWLGYAGWLINGVFGHDFYRIWWLAEAMIMLGVMTGAIVSADMGGNQSSGLEKPPAPAIIPKKPSEAGKT